MTHDIFPLSALQVLGALEGKNAEEMAQSLLEQEEGMREPKKFYWIDECGEIDYDEICEDYKDDITKHKSIGNYFETKEEAERAVEKLKAWKRLKDNGFKFRGVNETDGSIKTDLTKVVFLDKCEVELLFGGEE